MTHRQNNVSRAVLGKFLQSWKKDVRQHQAVGHHAVNERLLAYVCQTSMSNLSFWFYMKLMQRNEMGRREKCQQDLQIPAKINQFSDPTLMWLRFGLINIKER